VNPYLRASLICFALCGLLMYLVWGCANNGISGVCRHEATYAVSVMGEKYPARVAVGYRSGAYHSQAQVAQNNDWRWLCVEYPEVYVCAADATFEPHRYYVPWVWNIQMISGMVEDNRPR